MIARIDDLDNPDVLTEVWRQTMPGVNPADITPAHYLDRLEDTVTAMGWDAMRVLMMEQYRLTDHVLVSRFRQEHAGATVGDGYDPLKVVSRLGVVQLPRQVCYLSGEEHPILPGNAGLPAHTGQVTTRGLQEWACLLPQDLPFGTVERLLGWMAHDPQVISETQVRRRVCAHGAVGEPRRPAAWATELNQAVETALAQPDPQPPEGITAADWERVVQARRAETASTAERLRRLLRNRRRAVSPPVACGFNRLARKSNNVKILTQKNDGVPRCLGAFRFNKKYNHSLW